MNITDIVKKYLTDNGYDGLFNGSAECACKCDDIGPCYDGMISDCEAGYEVSCSGEDCEFHLDGEHWHIVRDKPVSDDGEER